LASCHQSNNEVVVVVGALEHWPGNVCLASCHQSNNEVVVVVAAEQGRQS
jgi:hypothetical protein